MANYYSGIFLHFEGTTSECDALQRRREIMYDTASGLLRYKRCDDVVQYITGGANWGTGTENYLPLWTASDTFTDSIVEQTDSKQITVYGSGVFEAESTNPSGVKEVLRLRRTTSSSTDGYDIGGAIVLDTERNYGDVYNVSTIDWGYDENRGRYLRLYADTITSPYSSSKLIIKDSSVGIIGWNDGGVTFNWGGSIDLTEDARINRQIVIPIRDLQEGSTPPDSVVLDVFKGWSYDIGDDSYFSFLMPKDYDHTENPDVFSVGIMYYTDEAYAANSGEVKWKIDWSAHYINLNQAIDSPVTTGSATSGDVNITSNAKGLQRSLIECSGSFHRDLLYGMNLSRVALDDGNNPTADPVVVGVYIYYVANTFGE